MTLDQDMSGLDQEVQSDVNFQDVSTHNKDSPVWISQDNIRLYSFARNHLIDQLLLRKKVKMPLSCGKRSPNNAMVSD